MMNVSEMADLIRELLNSQKLAVLCTQSKGQPYCNLIACAATPDLKYLLFATNRATRKYANLMADPRVSLLVDSRANEISDFADAAAATALGTAGELQGQEREHFLRIYLKKHPNLAEFVSAPTCALLRVKVDKYILVTRFQEVRELQIGA
jgi:nitroimidazol reductase NimA-like FMN-containing flavoprotein (pyridoxamine 5'-phosphate oxidase superfamily)